MKKEERFACHREGDQSEVHDMAELYSQLGPQNLYAGGSDVMSQ